MNRISSSRRVVSSPRLVIHHDTAGGGGRRKALVMAVVLLGIVLWVCRTSLWVVPVQETRTASIDKPRQLPGSIVSSATFGRQQALNVHRPAGGQESSVETGGLSANEQTNRARHPVKKILYYTTFWEEADFLFGEGSDVFRQCPVSDCWATSVKRPPFSQYDAVLFHPINRLHSLESIQQWQQPHQRFVRVHMESPRLYEHALLPYLGFFNWTMTYHWESDIPRPLGYFVPKQTRFSYAHLPAAWIPYNESRFRKSLPLRSPVFLARARKPSRAAWLVSNCHTASRREDYVKELQRYLNVSMAGRCSAHGRCDEDCYVRLERTTKFWLAFENAWCDDYVTEKSFRHMNDSVVVVWGKANYSRLAPPHSYVNALDYASPQALADYLLSMDKDTYLSYFWWQDYYEVSAPVGDSRAHFAQSMCRLCERLHLDTEQPKAYTNVSQWFVDRGRCRYNNQ